MPAEHEIKTSLSWIIILVRPTEGGRSMLKPRVCESGSHSPKTCSLPLVWTMRLNYGVFALGWTGDKAGVIIDG